VQSKAVVRKQQQQQRSSSNEQGLATGRRGEALFEFIATPSAPSASEESEPKTSKICSF
jgi:hypothetical protein